MNKNKAGGLATYLDVTEVSGELVSREQVERLFHRYKWASECCRGKDVLEIACGSGQGLGVLLGSANSVRAIDISEPLVALASHTYGDRLRLQVARADDTDVNDQCIDSVILFEAIYYLPDIEGFLNECDRVLRPGGQILIATANKDLYDFNPSPHSVCYYGTRELQSLLQTRGYDVELFGFYPVTQASFRQRLLRPIKRFVVKFGLMPKTMKGKEFLKRIVFGELVEMPAELGVDDFDYESPTPITPNVPDSRYKVLYCVARKKK